MIYLLTLSDKFSIAVLVAVFLPGTIIHELSHLIIATLLRVPTGELSVFPKINEEGEIQAGKLDLGNSDPFRQSLIGLAPMISGLAIIYFTGIFFFPSLQLTTLSILLITTNHQLTTILFFYLLFILSVTMFSSRKDLENLLIAGPITVLIFASLYLIGVRISFAQTLTGKVGEILTTLNSYLLAAITIDAIILLFLFAIIFLCQKILRRKIVYK